MFIAHSLTTLALLLLGMISAQQTASGRPSVSIDAGPLHGRTNDVAESNVMVQQFLGIPFAKPPINELRFAPPEKPRPWSESLDVSQQPNSCIQWLGVEGPARELREKLYNNPPLAAEDEDCLYLNVYVPEGGAENKSVLFWVHGGSGIMCSAAQALFDGSSLAANQDIVVGAPNYRLSGECSQDAA